MLPRSLKDYRLVVDRSPFPRGRYLYPVAGLTVLLTCLYLFKTDIESVAFVQTSLSSVASADLPPLYSEYHNAELASSQQGWAETRPSDGQRFLFIAGHTKGLGWGNAIQEQLFNAFLAYQTGTSLVFDNYTWADDGSQYSDYNGKLIPSQIPYSVLIRGPLVGDPFPPGDTAPLAVSKIYFDHICSEKRELDRNKIHGQMATEHSAALIVDTWDTVLHNIHDPCIETKKKSGPIFTHHHIFGIRGSLEGIWPTFAASPIVTQFGWSPLVEIAFDVNRDFYLPADSTEPFLSQTPFTSNADRYTMIPGLMAIHVRRGDYEEHCSLLADMSEDFVGVHTFPDMMDQFTPPPKPGFWQRHASSETKEMYRRRCYPSIEEIVEKVVDVRNTAAGSGVRRLFIMTNGKIDFISELRDALDEVAVWDSIASSRDMVLNWEQKYVAQAVDQLIAQRAQVLIGNGFSTLTSHAALMRKANGFPSENTRFW